MEYVDIYNINVLDKVNLLNTKKKTNKADPFFYRLLATLLFMYDCVALFH